MARPIRIAPSILSADFARLGAEGVDLLLVDSTNAEVPGFVTPERNIGPVLDRVIGKATQRVIVASFASHIHRIQQVLDVAATHGRQVAMVGRSMVRNMGIATVLGLLRPPAKVLVDLETALALPDDRVVLVSTGSQGEPLSALTRMARGEHKQVTIRAGDTVVLASSLIPGNETAVFSVVNGLARLGAHVVHQGTDTVHVSGHASAGELLFIYNAVRPSNVMPVHGEWRHLRANSALAVATGVPAQRVVLAEDGVVVDLVDGVASVSGRVHVGHVYVDGLSVGDVGEVRHRRFAQRSERVARALDRLGAVGVLTQDRGEANLDGHFDFYAPRTGDFATCATTGRVTIIPHRPRSGLPPR